MKEWFRKGGEPIIGRRTIKKKVIGKNKDQRKKKAYGKIEKIVESKIKNYVLFLKVITAASSNLGNTAIRVTP